jgi:2-aminoadipate transaminase
MEYQPSPQGTAANSISLRLGLPDSSSLDTPEFHEATRRVLASPHLLNALQYGDEQGNTALIHYLAEKITREQGVSVGTDQIMVVGGSTHAVDMIARLYTKAGSSVIVEAPTYADAVHIFRDHGVPLHSVPVDENGIMVEALGERLETLSATQNPARILYTIPNFHNPTGVTLSEERRVQILQLARQYHLTIVEDDVYRDLGFDQSTPPSFFALDDTNNTLQIGSFSKTLAPGLRLGWIVASPQAIQAFVNCGTTQMGGGANPFAAQIAVEYCQQGHWDAHIKHLRRLYRERRDVMLAALARYMPAEVRWTKPAGGFFVWVTLPTTIPASVIKQQAAERGVHVSSGEGYFVNPDDGKHNLRLAFSFASPHDIETGIRILGEVIAKIETA